MKTISVRHANLNLSVDVPSTYSPAECERIRTWLAECAKRVVEEQRAQIQRAFSEALLETKP